MIEHVKKFLDAGISVIPVIMPSKRPTVSWKEYQERPMTLEEFKAAAVGAGGLGVVCGKVSGGIEIIDFDNKFDLAKDTFSKYIKNPDVQKIIKKYNIPYESTLSGGYHIFYKCTEIEGNKKLAKVSREDKTECIIETRGERGYVVADPTDGYKLIHGSLFAIPTITVDDRNKLFTVARSFNELKETDITQWEEVRQTRHNSVVDANDVRFLLAENGWTPLGISGDNENWARPGKKFGNSASYNGEVFYVFTSNGAPFDSEKGYNNFQVFTLLKHGGNVTAAEKELIESGKLKKDEAVASGEFDIVKTKIKNDEFVYELDGKAFFQLLHHYGFYRFDREGHSIFVKVTGKVVEQVFLYDFIDFIKQHIDEDVGKLAYLSSIEHKILTEKKLSFLGKFRGKFNRDTKDKSFFYFVDCYYEVTADKIERKSYDKLNGYVWRDQIYEENMAEIDESVESDFMTFCQKVSITDSADLSRYETLVSMIGYACSNYKDPATAKAMVFCDQGDAATLDPDESQGGTGKSLICTAIAKMRNTAKKDARNFKFDSQFAFQEINESSEILWFDDANKWFKFDRLFSLITGDFVVEQKNKPSFVLPFKTSPKILIATNYTIAEQDASTKRRLHEVELAPVYDAEHAPVDDFGKRFFDEWDAKEWAAFRIFMFHCVQYYIKNGLKTYTPINLMMRKLLQSVPDEIAEFFEEYLKNFDDDLLGDNVIYFSDLFNQIGTNGTNSFKITQNKVSRWFKKYLSLSQINFIEIKSGAKRGVRVTKKHAGDKK